jgi:hypothetical protein
MAIGRPRARAKRRAYFLPLHAQITGRIAQLRAKMIEHLEAALAPADETSDGATGYLIETALDTIR